MLGEYLQQTHGAMLQMFLFKTILLLLGVRALCNDVIIHSALSLKGWDRTGLEVSTLEPIIPGPVLARSERTWNPLELKHEASHRWVCEWGRGAVRPSPPQAALLHTDGMGCFSCAKRVLTV
jgi:hypothetical protein